MKKYVITACAMLFTIHVHAQEKEQKEPEDGHLNLGLGMAFTFFQDVKYSRTQYYGIGTNFSFGYEKSGKNYLSTNFNLIHSRENAETHSRGKTGVLHGVLDLSYLWSVYKEEKNRIELGAKWDILSFYLRQTEGLGNNSIYYISASNLKLSSTYRRALSDVVELRAGTHFQVFSFMKESTSFGFSAPQDPLEDGEFSYQNDDLEDPFGFKYFSLEPFTKYLNIETFVALEYKDKWLFGYNWNMQRSGEVRNYPMILGYSLVSVKYQF
jgi:hypothetical protein